MPDLDLTPRNVGGPSGGMMANPLGLVEGIVGMRGQLLQQQLAGQSIYVQQQQIQARQLAGQIIASSPPGDFETMTKNLQSNQAVSAWLPDIFKSVNEAKTAILTARGLELDQNSKAWDIYRKSLAQVEENPTPQGITDTIKSNLAVLPKSMQATLTPMFEASAVGLMRGIQPLTGDPQQDAQIKAHNAQVITQNAIGQVMGAGVSPDIAFGAAGATPPQNISGEFGPQGQKTVAQVGGYRGVGGQVPMGPSLTQGKYLESRGTDMADYQKGLDDRVKMGQQILQTIEPAWGAIKELEKAGGSPGGLATARMHIGQLAQGLGASPETVAAISNGSLPASQELSKLMVNTTMSQISQQLPAMSKMAVSEFNAFMANNPNLDTDPRAIEKIFNFWSKVQAVNRTEQSELNKFVGKGGNVSEWPAKWQEIAEKRGLVNPNPTGTAGGEGEKPRPPLSSFFK